MGEGKKGMQGAWYRKTGSMVTNGTKRVALVPDNTFWHLLSIFCVSGEELHTLHVIAHSILTTI